MSNESFAIDPAPKSDPQLCSHCGFPLSEYKAGIRHFGTHTAHVEWYCTQRLRSQIERLTAELAQQRTADEPNPPKTPAPEAAHEMGAKGGRASDAERLGFEAWARKNGWKDFDFRAGGYTSPSLSGAWLAWKHWTKPQTHCHEGDCHYFGQKRPASCACSRA